MVKINCQACGRRYDYDKEGICPNCGAYNRPPRRETVDANGVVRHLNVVEDEEWEEEVPQGKVCYEQQECHEDIPRKVRTHKSGENRRKSLPYEKIAAKASDYSGKKKKAQMIAIGAVLLSMVTTIIGNLSARKVEVVPEPEAGIAQVEERAVELEGSVETKDGRFSIVSWGMNGKRFEVQYTANFDPMEKGSIFVKYVNLMTEEYDMMTPVESCYYGDWGLLTFEANTRNFEPMALCLEYENETFWFDLS